MCMCNVDIYLCYRSVECICCVVSQTIGYGWHCVMFSDRLPIIHIWHSSDSTVDIQWQIQDCLEVVRFCPKDLVTFSSRHTPLDADIRFKPNPSKPVSTTPASISCHPRRFTYQIHPHPRIVSKIYLSLWGRFDRTQRTPWIRIWYSRCFSYRVLLSRTVNVVGISSQLLAARYTRYLCRYW